MRLSDLNKLIFFLIFFFNFNHLMAENEIDIWKKVIQIIQRQI